MTAVVLSSGCFVQHESLIASSSVQTVELASHRSETLDNVLRRFAASSTRVLGVHSPCPNHGMGLNLAARDAKWDDTARRLRATMELAASLEAEYVVIHAFYCLQDDLPADDLQRAIALRRIAERPRSIVGYVDSEAYHEAKERTKRNLRTILPELAREFPHQKIVLENLNPRIGYGGIRFSDVVDIVSDFGGVIGICLDVGHLVLSARALGETMEDDIARAKDLIWTTHVHQNFAGTYYVDRRWDEDTSRPGLQDVDTHLPFLCRYRLLDRPRPHRIMEDNSAFESLLDAPVQHTSDPDAETVAGAVPLEHLLSLIPESAVRVLEYDSRYAPLHEILQEYESARQGTHPFLGT